MEGRVARQRLLEALAGARVAAIVAPGGYGKSVLVEQLADGSGLDLVSVRFEAHDRGADAMHLRLTAALRRAGIETAKLEDLGSSAVPADALGSTLDGAGDVLVSFDDVHHLDEAGARVLVSLVDELRSHAPVVVSGRSAIPGLLPDAALDEAALAFTADELGALLAERGVEVGGPAVRALWRSTGGWTVALSLAADELVAATSNRRRTMRVDGLAEELAQQPRLLAYLIESRLATVDDPARVAIARLAHLPLLGPAIGRCASFDDEATDAFAALTRCGLPTVAAGTGWSRFLDPVREHLTALAVPDRAVARAASAIYVRHRELGAAAAVLLDAGCADEAAGLLADLPTSWLERLEVTELRAIVSRLPAAVLDRHPRLLLQLARADASAARSGTRAQLLDRVAERLVAAGEDRDLLLERELAAERALDLVRDGHAIEAAELVDATLRECGPQELDARVRLLDARGRARAWAASHDSDLQAAADDLREAARGADELGQFRVRSQILAALGYQVLYRLGRLDDAADALLSAADVASGLQRQRAVVLTFAAEVLSYAGRSERAAEVLLEAASTAARLDDSRLRAYVAWEQARANAFLDDRDGVVAAVAEVERHPGDWWEHGTAMVFLAEAADWLDRIGEHEVAAEKLAAAHQRMDTLGDDPAVLVVAASIAARGGRPAEAAALVERAEATEAVPPQTQWRLDLIRAAAAQASSDPRAAAMARGALDVASRIGDGEVAARVEPALVSRFRGLVAASAEPVWIRVLGGFEITCGGERLTVPSGQPAQLVKFLICSGGAATVDAVIDALWPDVDEVTGRKLLRNVLSRLRRGADELVALVEREGSRLRLMRGAEVDAFRLSALASESGAAGSAVLQVPAGPLLPDDLFVPWTEMARARAARELLEVCDRAARRAEGAGDPAMAITLLQRAIEADPYDESLALRRARLQRSTGDVVGGRRTLAAAETSLAELDLPPSPHLVALRAELASPPRSRPE